MNIFIRNSRVPRKKANEPTGSRPQVKNNWLKIKTLNPKM